MEGDSGGPISGVTQTETERQDLYYRQLSPDHPLGPPGSGLRVRGSTCLPFHWKLLRVEAITTTS